MEIIFSDYGEFTVENTKDEKGIFLELKPERIKTNKGPASNDNERTIRKWQALDMRVIHFRVFCDIIKQHPGIYKWRYSTDKINWSEWEKQIFPLYKEDRGEIELKEITNYRDRFKKYRRFHIELPINPHFGEVSLYIDDRKICPLIFEDCSCEFLLEKSFCGNNYKIVFHEDLQKILQIEPINVK